MVYPTGEDVISIFDCALLVRALLSVQDVTRASTAMMSVGIAAMGSPETTVPGSGSTRC